MRVARRTAVSNTPSDAQGLWIAPALVVAATIAAFLPVLAAGFVNFDDDRVLLRNPYWKLAWPERFAWMWSTLHMGHYQPLTWLSLSLDRALGDGNPAVYHADSLLLHAGAALALYALIVEILAIASGGSRTARVRACA